MKINITRRIGALRKSPILKECDHLTRGVRLEHLRKIMLESKESLLEGI